MCWHLAVAEYWGPRDEICVRITALTVRHTVPFKCLDSYPAVCRRSTVAILVAIHAMLVNVVPGPIAKRNWISFGRNWHKRKDHTQCGKRKQPDETTCGAHCTNP